MRVERFSLVVAIRPVAVPADVRFRGQSGHGSRVAECPLMTQSGHSGYSAAIRPGAFTWDVILRRTISM
jgi:hypothetical protein